MVVLFYNRDFNSINSGGVDRISYNLAAQFVKSGIYVLFISSTGKYTGFDSVSSHCLHFPNAQLECEENIRFFESVINKFSVDIVINQSAMSSQYSNFLNRCLKNNETVRIISCVHNLVITPAINWGYQHEYTLRKKHLGIIAQILKLNCLKKILKILYIKKYRSHYRKLVNFSSLVVALCDGHKMEIEEMIGFESRKIVVIPNCIAPSETVNSVNKEKIALWIGRLDFTVKRIDVMLQVWNLFLRKQPDWHLYILGTSPEFEYVKKMSEEMNLCNIHFEGSVDPSSYYDRASVTFVTSSHESFSMVILESMFHKVVPVVFNTFPAASYLVKDSINGILVEPYDIESCVSHICDVLEEKSKLSKMQESAFDSCARFYPSKVFKIWNAHFEKLSRMKC